MKSKPDLVLDRRALIACGLASLCGGAAAPLHVLAQGQGQGLARFKAPLVDRLTLQVLVDNATFGPFLPNLTLPGLEVRRETGDRRARMSRQALKAEFGLSILGTSQVGDQTRRVLVDFGYTPETLSNNLALLGVDPDQFDAAVLSHGHLDHYGGFAGLFEGRVAKQRHLPLYVGGEEAFCERVAMIASPPPVMGALDRGELAKAGFAVRIAPGPEVIADQAFTTGVIALTSSERAAIPTAMRAGVGCDAARLSPGKRDGQTADDGEHELATCYVVKGLGLVVISCCSHRGVLNAVRQAQVLSGVDKVHAVVGGFHLVRPRTEDEARQTAAEFVKIDPTYIVPMHCTGEVFIAEATRLMPSKVIRPYVGTQLVFDGQA
jgi:7,8-dihydropterin-6-yl-methyl-4-(beta-D-ribofuranosyl)aminobenzene 5'-phosphate synthase